jgi:predicted acyl esterase
MLVVLVVLLSVVSLALCRDRRHEAIYLTTRDGVNLATQIIFPKDTASSGNTANTTNAD